MPQPSEEFHLDKLEDQQTTAEMSIPRWNRHNEGLDAKSNFRIRGEMRSCSFASVHHLYRSRLSD
jgi:hypothetical protein